LLRLTYGGGAVTNPTGPALGSYRMIRGGNWDNNAPYSRSAYRYFDHPSYSSPYIGFRPARSVF
jgi:sulfatase modifying factor 1